MQAASNTFQNNNIGLELTIACDNDELILGGDIMNDDLWVDGNNLLFRREGVVLFELKVANGS